MVRLRGSLLLPRDPHEETAFRSASGLPAPLGTETAQLALSNSFMGVRDAVIRLRMR